MTQDVTSLSAINTGGPGNRRLFGGGLGKILPDAGVLSDNGDRVLFTHSGGAGSEAFGADRLDNLRDSRDTLTFSRFNPGTNSLTIENWTGTAATAGSGATDRLIFASDQSGNLGSFNFTGFGPGAVKFNLGGGYYEIAPVPEPGTYISGLVALAVILFHYRRQIRRSFLRRSRTK